MAVKYRTNAFWMAHWHLERWGLVSPNWAPRWDSSDRRGMTPGHWLPWLMMVIGTLCSTICSWSLPETLLHLQTSSPGIFSPLFVTFLIKSFPNCKGAQNVLMWGLCTWTPSFESLQTQDHLAQVPPPHVGNGLDALVHVLQPCRGSHLNALLWPMRIFTVWLLTDLPFPFSSYL